VTFSILVLEDLLFIDKAKLFYTNHLRTKINLANRSLGVSVTIRRRLPCDATEEQGLTAREPPFDD
jgi:hypothetical protein